jgi:hypothetical protein
MGKRFLLNIKHKYQDFETCLISMEILYFYRYILFFSKSLDLAIELLYEYLK